MLDLLKLLTRRTTIWHGQFAEEFCLHDHPFAFHWFLFGEEERGIGVRAKDWFAGCNIGGGKTVGIGSGVVVGSPLQAATAKHTPMSTSHLCQVAAE